MKRASYPAGSALGVASSPLGIHVRVAADPGVGQTATSMNDDVGSHTAAAT